MKKYKVLIVHNYYKISGGEDVVVENEKNLLEENGHEVVLYTRNNTEIKNKNIILACETIFSIKTYIDIKKLIIKKKIDIIHVHNTLPLISPAVYYVANKYKIPVVQTIHNFRLLCPGATLTRNNKICEECISKSLLCAIKNKCYRNSLIESSIATISLAIHRAIGTYNKINAYITLTEFNKEKLSNIINKDKIFIKSNFMKNTIINCEENKNYFLYVGRIDKIKGIEILLKAWKKIKNVELFIVGKGPFEKEAIKYIYDNKIKNIKFLGFKNKIEILKLMKSSKALIVPSQWYEGFPMTIVESLSVGTPIIASNIGNLSTIIENEKNGLLFKYKDENDLYEKIKILLNDNKLRKKLSDGAKKSFDEKYNSEINYKILKEIYDKCMGEIDV